MAHDPGDFFKLGVSFHKIDPQQRLETLSVFSNSSVAALELYEPVFKEGNALKGDLSKYFIDAGVVARSVHAAFGDLSSPEPKVRFASVDGVRKALDLAQRVGAHIVVVHASGEPVPAESRSQRIRYVRESLGTIEQLAIEKQLRIAVELLPRTCLGRTVPELFELIDGFDTNTVGLCLDTNHLMADYQQLPAVVRAMGSRLLALHCSDYDGIDEKHWPPLKGVIDWNAFLNALYEIRFTGPVSYEAHCDGDSPEQRLHFLESNFARLMDLWRNKGTPEPADPGGA